MSSVEHVSAVQLPAPDLPRVKLSGGVVAAAATILAFVGLARYGFTALGLIAAGGLATLVVLAAIDLRERRLPNAIVLPAAAAVLVSTALLVPERAVEAAGASLLAFAAMLILALVNPQGLGMGDVKLALLLGALLGADVVGAFVVAFVAVLPVAAVLLARHGAAARRATLPLGPFLAAGAATMLLLAGPGDRSIGTVGEPQAVVQGTAR